MVETIFALSTAPGKSGVAVIRLSGTESLRIVNDLSRGKSIKAREALLADLYTPQGEKIDRGIILYFQSPNSFTGEDVVELQVHGSLAVIKSLLKTLGERDDCRLAEPGEFSKRAFEHGKMDLTEAEGLADLIAAETEVQRKTALSQLDGGLRTLYESFRIRVIEACAYLEAHLDFVDEEDVPPDIISEAKRKAKDLIVSISKHLKEGAGGERLVHGLSLAVVGEPNVGKSSFINALARRDVAIVSEIPGTTRDLIEVNLDFEGYPIQLVDTAGLRETQDLIEQEGVRRARERGEKADLVLQILDATHSAPRGAILNREPDILLVNKVDVAQPENTPLGAHRVSVKTGAGMAEVKAALKKAIEKLIGTAETPLMTRERYRIGLLKAVAALESALMAREPELMAEDLRLAAREIGRLTGHVDVEDLLDIIFSDFCIGK